MNLTFKIPTVERAYVAIQRMHKAMEVLGADMTGIDAQIRRTFLRDKKLPGRMFHVNLTRLQQMMSASMGQEKHKPEAKGPFWKWFMIESILVRNILDALPAAGWRCVPDIEVPIKHRSLVHRYGITRFPMRGFFQAAFGVPNSVAMVLAHDSISQVPTLNVGPAYQIHQELMSLYLGVGALIHEAGKSQGDLCIGCPEGAGILRIVPEIRARAATLYKILDKLLHQGGHPDRLSHLTYHMENLSMATTDFASISQQLSFPANE